MRRNGNPLRFDLFNFLINGWVHLWVSSIRVKKLNEHNHRDFIPSVCVFWYLFIYCIMDSFFLRRVNVCGCPPLWCLKMLSVFYLIDLSFLDKMESKFGTFEACWVWINYVTGHSLITLRTLLGSANVHTQPRDSFVLSHNFNRPKTAGKHP